MDGRFLAQADVDVNATSEFGDTALVDTAVLGADPNALSDTRDNVLDAAVRSGNARLVDLLPSAGAKPNYETDLGLTFLDALPTKKQPAPCLSMFSAGTA